MSQVWPLRTAFKGREEFRLPYYYPRKQRAAVRCDCSTEPAPLSGCPSMGELCPLQLALETCRKSIQLLGVYPSVPSPVEEELTGRGRRLVTFNLQLERSWIPGAPVWNTASVEPVMAMPSCFPDSSGLALPSLADLSFSLPASDRMSTSQTLMTIMHELAELHNCLRHPLCWPAGRGTSWLCWNLLHVSGKWGTAGGAALGSAAGAQHTHCPLQVLMETEKQHNFLRRTKRMSSWTSLRKISHPFATKYHTNRTTSEQAIQ